MKNNQRLSIRALSVVLAIVLIIASLPVQAFANDVKLKNIEVGKNTQSEYSELKVVGEVKSSDAGCKKTYELEDGTYLEISSSKAIQITEDYTKDLTANELTSQIRENTSGNNRNNETNVNLNDGLVKADRPQSLYLYTATGEYVIDENTEEEVFEWTLTNNSGTIGSDSFLLVKPSALDPFVPNGNNNVYSKAEVTVNASIILSTSLTGNQTAKTYIQRITAGWDGQTLDLDEALAFDEEGEDDFEFANVSEQKYDYNSFSSSGDFSYDITAAYKNFENGTYINNGFIVSSVNGNDIEIDGGIFVRYYRVIDENDTGFYYSSEDMGRAGTLFINNYTAIPHLKRDELSISGELSPVSVSRTINPGITLDASGSSMRWNYSSVLQYDSDIFYWELPDGSSKRYQRTNETQNGFELWKEYLYNGGDSVLYVNPSSTLSPFDYSSNYIVEDSKTYRFNSSGKLVKIESQTNNINSSIDITYNAGGKITSIQDGVEREYRFSYSGSNVTSIIVYDSQNNQIYFEDDSVNNRTPIGLTYTYERINGHYCLKTVTYPDNEIVEYDYDSYGRLTNIKDIDNTRLSISYYNNNPNNSLNPVYYSRIRSYSKSYYNASTLEYENYYTVNFDSDNVYRRTIRTVFPNNYTTKSYYQYNNNIDLLYMTDSKGNEYYADYDNTHNLMSIVIEDGSNNLIMNGNMDKKKTAKPQPQSFNASANLMTQQQKMTKETDVNSYYFSMNMISNDKYYIYQEIDDINGSEGDKYVISADGMGEATIPTSERFWGIEIYTIDSNNNVSNEPIHRMEFDTSMWGEWQSRKTAFSLPYDTNKLMVCLVGSKQESWVAFDNIELYKTQKSYVNNGESNSNSCGCSFCNEPSCPCTCSNENNCTCIQCHRGTNVVYSNGNKITNNTDGVDTIQGVQRYSNSGNYLAKSIDEFGAATYYTYDEASGSLKQISSNNSSDADVNYINYKYNSVGLLKQVSQTVTNIVTGTTTDMLSSYDYDGDRLTEINHNGTIYSFDYDMYGNVSAVSVSNTTLATYDYSSPTNMNCITYANGDKIHYTYDDMGNILTISTQSHEEVNDSLIEYNYSYSKGKLTQCVDNLNRTMTLYSDDSITIRKINNDNTFGDTIYDSNINENEESISLNGSTYNVTRSSEYTSSSGNTNSTTSYTIPNEIQNCTSLGSIVSIKDYFGRNLNENIEFSLVDTNNNDELSKVRIENTFTYDNNNHITNRLVKTYTTTMYKLNANSNMEQVYSITYSYNYDNCGRITRIYKNNILLSDYTYDEAGQLVQEINAKNNSFSAIRYTYDGGGNIKAKYKYDQVSYNDSTDIFTFGAVSNTITFNYTNQNWKDLLTEVSGEAISYDLIGNPTNYFGSTFGNSSVKGQMKWNGKQLVEFIKTDDNNTPTNKYVYKYNADGMRTKKTSYKYNANTESYDAADSEVNYVWNDDLLVGYTITTNPETEPNTTTVLLIYNDEELPIGINVKGDTTLINSAVGNGNQNQNDYTEFNLYFAKNASGDVVSLYSDTIDIGGTYTYDALGNCVEWNLTGQNADELRAALNNIDSGNIWADILVAIIIGIVYVAVNAAILTLEAETYRGYIYDLETGLYYNENRYYSPAWGRFINADEVLDTYSGTPNANNVFAYCENDFVNFSDANGLARKEINKTKNATILWGSSLKLKVKAVVTWSKTRAGISINAIIDLYLSQKASNIYSTSISTIAGAVAAVFSALLLASTGGTAAVVVPIVVQAVVTIIMHTYYEGYKKDSNGRIRIYKNFYRSYSRSI